MKYTFLIPVMLMSNIVYSATSEYNLVVAEKNVVFSGCGAVALAINDQIPAPTLRFKEGDEVIINVRNHLNEGTALHWHGVLLPWIMDGVENITQNPIKPGESFTYRFTAKQSGTYWYHAHAGLQEQSGLYGAFIIEPKNRPTYSYNKDIPIVLSDWTDTPPEQVQANLKKTGDYYSSRMPIQPSLNKYLTDLENAPEEKKEKIKADYSMMQDMRMSIYDLSDVAYDAFLLNGHPSTNPWKKDVEVGDVVRLRFVGAMGSTRYQVKIPHETLQVVHIQGKDVEAYNVDHFTISPGETIDVLVHITKKKPYIIYAESIDKRGVAIGALITEQGQHISFKEILPFPDPQPVTMGHSHHMHMSHEDPMTMGTKYDELKSAYKTNDPDKPYTEIKMVLDGYMGRYIWFINGKTEHEVDPIQIEPGKRYRLIFTNNSMMYHPMHLHGHFMILRNGNDEYDPMLHTIEVPPGATAVADFDADAEGGQWFFHCHHLFHMVSGMARLFQYTGVHEEAQKYGLEQLTHHPMAHPIHLQKALFLDLSADPFHNVQKANLDLLIGWDYHKLQFYSEDAEIKKGKVESADLDIFYWHLIDQFWVVKGGLNITYKPAKHTYVQPGIGLEGTMPYFIDTNLRMYAHDGNIKLDLQLARDTQITNDFFFRTGFRGKASMKTKPDYEEGKGLYNLELLLRPYYQLNPRLALFTELNYHELVGPLRREEKRSRNPIRESVMTFGLSVLY